MHVSDSPSSRTVRRVALAAASALVLMGIGATGASAATTVVENPVHGVGPANRSFDITADVGNANVWCSVDVAPGLVIDYAGLDAQYPDCGGPGGALSVFTKTLAGLSDGPHTIYVASGNDAGSDPLFLDYDATSFSSRRPQV